MKLTLPAGGFVPSRDINDSKEGKAHESEPDSQAYEKRVGFGTIGTSTIARCPVVGRINPICCLCHQALR
jgi:hypothetical protein